MIDRMMTLRRRTWLVVLFALVAGACDAGRVVEIRIPGATDIQLDSLHFAINDGSSYQVEVVVIDSAGNEMALEPAWETSNAGVVTVSSTGVLTGHRPGTAEVTASVGDVSRTATVDVLIVPTRLEPVSGTDQVGQAHAPLPEDVAVRLLDRHGEPVPSVEVDFMVQAGGGEVSPPSALTDENGVASATWVLGDAGEQEIAGVARKPEHVQTIADSVVVFSAMAEPGESVSPERVSDVEVTGVTTETVSLRWTAVADGTGTGAKYALRYGSPTISWGSAFDTERTIESSPAGQVITYTYTNLQPNTNYEFQLVSYRGTLQVDPVFGSRSNVVAAATEPVDTGEPIDSLVASITATPATHTFTQLGATMQIEATARNAAGSVIGGAALSWTSTNPSVVSVNSTGRMTAQAAGTAMIIIGSVCCSAADTITASVELQAPGEVAYADGFEDYSVGAVVNSADGQGGGGFRWGNGNGDGAFVSSERAHSGSQSLRFRYAPSGHVWAEQRMDFNPVIREMWLEYWLYVPANFVHPDPGPSNNKFIRVFGNDPNHDSGTRNVSGGASFLPDNQGTRVNHVNLQWGDIDDPFTINSGEAFTWITTDGSGATQQPGTWSQIRYHVRMASAPGVPNGIQQMWLDGVLVAENVNIPWANPNVPGFDEGYLLGYDNSRYPEEMIFYIDDFRFYTANPGW